MQLARIVGSVWASCKTPALVGFKLLYASVVSDCPSPCLVVADDLDAGIGDIVIITGGSAARVSKKNSQLPIDAIVVAIVDDGAAEEDICLQN